jgi:hypothetical protein
MGDINLSMPCKLALVSSCGSSKLLAFCFPKDLTKKLIDVECPAQNDKPDET